jgi:tetratricopeptide (TPR) repeat protein
VQSTVFGWLKKKGRLDPASRETPIEPVESKALADAIALEQAGQWGEAMLRFEALAEGDGDPRALLGLARIRFAQRQWSMARDLIERVLEALPDSADAYGLLADLHLERGELDEARENADIALHHAPEHARALVVLGQLELKRRRFDVAAKLFDRALESDPVSSAATAAQLTALDGLEQYERMREVADKWLEREPRSIDARGWKGLALTRLSLHEDAIGVLEDTLRDIANVQIPARLALGSAYFYSGRDADALAQYNIVLNAEPRSFDGRYYRAHWYLAHGEYAKGWEDYRFRTFSGGEKIRPIALPLWGGEALDGRSIVLLAEQGLGDEVMFASVFEDVIKRARRAVIECDPRLGTLFARSFPSAEIVARRRETAPSWIADYAPLDCYALIGDLPRFFRKQIQDFPRHTGYLRPSAEKVAAWRARLERLGPGLKVGISWRGGSAITRRPIRSIPLSQWAPIFATPGASFVNLQYGDCAAELETLARDSGVRVHHWPEALGDYDDTAALCGALDLTISVCTSLIHLNGALGRPVWVLTPRVPEWRYGRASDELIWYPSVRLLRQGDDRQWAPVIQKAAAMLRGYGRP